MVRKIVPGGEIVSLECFRLLIRPSIADLAGLKWVPGTISVGPISLVAPLG